METEKQTTEEKTIETETQEEQPPQKGKRIAADDGEKSPGSGDEGESKKEPPKKRQARQPKKSGDEASKSEGDTQRVDKKKSASSGDASKQQQQPEQEKKKRHRKAKYVGYKLYIHNLMSHRYPDTTVSKGALHILNAYAMDIQSRLCERSAELVRYSERHTITSREIDVAAKTMFNRDVSSVLIEAGIKATQAYSASE